MAHCASLRRTRRASWSECPLWTGCDLGRHPDGPPPSTHGPFGAKGHGPPSSRLAHEQQPNPHVCRNFNAFLHLSDSEASASTLQSLRLPLPESGPASLPTTDAQAIPGRCRAQQILWLREVSFVGRDDRSALGDGLCRHRNRHAHSCHGAMGVRLVGARA